ncbi:MAG TPA: hypothetical protein VGL91_15255 [Acidobacteriota bacterium]
MISRQVDAAGLQKTPMLACRALPATAPWAAHNGGGQAASISQISITQSIMAA